MNAAQDAALQAPWQPALRKALLGLMRRRGAAGAQYLLHRPGAAPLELCLGEAEAPGGAPVTPATTFNLYSLTKPFTAAAVLRLAGEGRLDLAANIGAAAGIDGLGAFGTVQDTLPHVAGLPNPMPLAWFHLAETHADFDEGAFVDRVLGRLAGTTARRRGRLAYSNVGYLLLGRAVQRSSGLPFTRLVDEAVLQPLGLRDDERLAFAIVEPALHAHGHLRRFFPLDWLLGRFVDRSTIVAQASGRWVRLRHHHVNGSAYGGLMGNARGLARFGRAVLGQVPGVEAGVRARLFEAAPGSGRSLGWFSGQLLGRPWFAHAGGGLGYYAELRLYPTLGAVSVLLTNGPGLHDAHALDGLDRAWIATAAPTRETSP